MELLALFYCISKSILKFENFLYLVAIIMCDKLNYTIETIACASCTVYKSEMSIEFNVYNFFLFTMLKIVR